MAKGIAAVHHFRAQTPTFFVSFVSFVVKISPRRTRRSRRELFTLLPCGS